MQIERRGGSRHWTDFTVLGDAPIWIGEGCDLSSRSEMSVIGFPFNFVHSPRMNGVPMGWDLKRGRIDSGKEEINKLTQIDDDQDLK
jgi:hypothetical protein